MSITSPTLVDLEKYPGITPEMLQDFIEKAYEEVKRDNYLVVTFGYDSKLVFNYDDGMAVVTLLRRAETYKKEYSTNAEITPYKSEVEFKVLAQEEYVQAKLKHLLEIHKEKPEPDDKG